MGGSAGAISRIYLRSALRSPVSWIAFIAAVFYTVMVSIDDPFFLAQAGIELGLVETVLQVFFNNAFYTSWGLFIPFLFMIAPMLHERERERLVAIRSGGRFELWIAKILAIVQLSMLFLGMHMLIGLALIAPGKELSLLDWTDGYVEVTHKVAAAPEGSLDPNYYDVASEYLVGNMRPWSTAIIQIMLFLLAFVVGGSLCAVLAQWIDRSAVTFIVTAAFWLLTLVLAEGGVPIWFFSPQAHILLGLRSEYFPYWVSVVYLGSAFIILSIAGWYGQRRAILG